MREVTKTVAQFLMGLVLVLVVSAFLTPWLHSFLPFKFSRIFRRLIMIGTLILIFGLIRTRRQSLVQMGLRWHQDSLRLLGMGFFAGCLVIVGITLIQWSLGARFWHLYEKDGWHWIGLFFKALGAGVLIGLIEEFFFRGFLFLTLKELWNTKASLVVTNLIYALVHFFPKTNPPPGVHPTIADSFRLLQAMVPSPSGMLEILPGVLGLFFFGLILSFVFLRRGSLFPSIGIHAGAVFSLKLNRRFLPEISEKMNIGSGSKNLYDGVLGILVLIALSFLASRCLPSRTKDE